jgi:hypothetical protein
MSLYTKPKRVRGEVWVKPIIHGSGLFSTIERQLDSQWLTLDRDLSLRRSSDTCTPVSEGSIWLKNPAMYQSWEALQIPQNPLAKSQPWLTFWKHSTHQFFCYNEKAAKKVDPSQ